MSPAAVAAAIDLIEEGMTDEQAEAIIRLAAAVDDIYVRAD